MKKRSFSHKGFSLVELLVVVAILGILSAVGIVSYIGYVDQARITDAKNNVKGIYMVQEDLRASTGSYYTTDAGAICIPDATDNALINTNLYGDRTQLEETDPDFVYCIATGTATDGGYLIFSDSSDGAHSITLNANNTGGGCW